MLLSYQQTLLDGLLVNSPGSHPFCHILLGVSVLKEGEHNVREGLNVRNHHICIVYVHYR